ncbi:hypothetical protein CUMW_058770 [Citrus unshiu]|nr:hypothetical protein CUMW_058770 [Citrus unshiu]
MHEYFLGTESLPIGLPDCRKDFLIRVSVNWLGKWKSELIVSQPWKNSREDLCCRSSTSCYLTHESPKHFRDGMHEMPFLTGLCQLGAVMPTAHQPEREALLPVCSWWYLKLESYMLDL